jgi:transposase-like protein
MPKSTYTPEKAEAILALMREGESLRKACEATGVSKGSFLRWVDDVEGLADQYARAREEMLDAQAEELELIGDQAANAETAVQVAGLRLKADNRKWLLSKLAPKRYGDKLELSGDPKNPLQTVTRIELVPLGVSDADR